MGSLPRFLACCSFLWLTLATYVHADPISFTFGGIVTRSFGIAPQEFGDIVDGSFTLDLARLSVTEQSETARRYEGPTDLLLSFRRPPTETPLIDYSFRNAQLNLVVNNDVFGPSNPVDAFRLGIRADHSGDIFGFGFFLTDSTGTAFSSTELPLDLNLLAFNGVNSRLFSGVFVNAEETLLLGQFDGRVTLLNGIEAPAPIPEPTTMLLLGTGLAAIAARTRRRAKQH
jgi:hypothetical protein